MNIKVSCAIIIYDEKNNLLIAKRSKNKSFEPGLRETLGGNLQHGESPEECIRREIREEIECEIKKLEFFNVYSFLAKDGIQLITIVYSGKTNEAPKFNTKEIEEIKRISEKDTLPLNYSINCEQRIKDRFNTRKSKLLH